MQVTFYQLDLPTVLVSPDPQKLKSCSSEPRVGTGRSLWALSTVVQLGDSCQGCCWPLDGYGGKPGPGQQALTTYVRPHSTFKDLAVINIMCAPTPSTQ